MLRGEVLTFLAVLGHDITLSEGKRRFRAFLDDDRNTPLLPPDTRKAAYVAVMQSASKSDRWGYESLLRAYRESDLSQEKTRVLGSLTSCRDPDIVHEALNFSLFSEVRSQDAVFGLAVSKEGCEVVWKWLQYEQFFATRTKPSVARTLKQSLGRVHINANWVKSIQAEKQLEEVIKELAHQKH